MSYFEKCDDIVIEMAENCDKRAISTLQRIFTQNADVSKRQKAADLLAALEAPMDTS